jgi:hypothetical protein
MVFKTLHADLDNWVFAAAAINVRNFSSTRVPLVSAAIVPGYEGGSGWFGLAAFSRQVAATQPVTCPIRVSGPIALLGDQYLS